MDCVCHSVRNLDYLVDVKIGLRFVGICQNLPTINNIFGEFHLMPTKTEKTGLSEDQILKIEEFVENSRRGKYRLALYCLMVFLLSLIVGLHVAEYMI